MKIRFTLLVLLISFSAKAQEFKHELEVMPFIRYDSYPTFTYRYFDRGPANKLKMDGKNKGVSLNYKFLVAKNIRLNVGINYYQFTFENLNYVNSEGNKTNERPIEYPSLNKIYYYTDEYQYNCLGLNAGVEKVIPLGHGFQILTGINLSNYNTFSQKYHITGLNQNYKTNDIRVFGYSVFSNVGITKMVKGYSFGPSLILPIFDSWKKDEIFGEHPNESRSKWRGGFGAGWTIAKAF